ncbi:di-heme oxidoredictase family protein [Geminicoccus harenae]|uniref:di-heme oxidoredictase family protein n=2 Tax=Geminicoccus harenae TaxID=2498453 RepID=UPI001C98E192|nr:di-heme oxidoredictase family protein [Geminicoccus harenae]
MRWLAAPLLLAAALLTPDPAGSRDLDAAVGKALFRRIWTVAGASNRQSDGLGPLFNARACTSCHEGAGGGRMADGAGLVLRFDDDPAYGRQLQTAAAPGHEPEGRLEVRWQPAPRRLADGSTVALRRPVPQLVTLDAAVESGRGSLRLAPGLAGLGLVEQALAEAGEPGGFGLKAAHASLAQPVTEALLLDLGLSTTDHPEPWGDCTEAAPTCRQGPHGSGDGEGGVELAPGIVQALLAYLRFLPPPAPSGPLDPDGLHLFASLGCNGCHRPELGGLQPYSDFQAHDLGAGLASDERDAGLGRRWRTAPLWGLGRRLMEGRPLLHDGRARDAEEAILWHDGAARTASAGYAALPEAERARLLAFLERL